MSVREKPKWCCLLWLLIAVPWVCPAAEPCLPTEPMVAGSEGVVAAAPGTEGEVAALPALDHTDWQLTELKGQAVHGGRRPVGLRFHAQQGSIRGFAGCNTFSATYETTGQTLRITRIRVTRRVCAQGMELEREYLRALESTTTYTLRTGILELYSGQTLQMRFRAVSE